MALGEKFFFYVFVCFLNNNGNQVELERYLVEVCDENNSLL